MRISSLDILKCIGIILVVFGHMIGNQLYIRPWIYAFHMPMFFMISGYCFNKARHPQYSSFVVTRYWTLLVPCALYTIISFLISPEYICEGRYHELATQLPYALWFLPILFIVEILGYTITCFEEKRKIFILLLCAGLATYFHYLKLPLTYRLIQVPMCLLFFLTGNILRNYTIVEKFLANKLMSLWQYYLLGLVGCALTYIYVRLDALKHNQEILNYFEIGMVFACFSAIIGVASFSVILAEKKMGNALIYIGKNTLVVMSTQGIFISLSDYYFRPLIPSFAIYKPLSFIFVFACCFIMIALINKYIPILAGKRKIL